MIRFGVKRHDVLENRKRDYLRNPLTVCFRLTFLFLVASVSSASQDNPVLSWNQVVLDSILITRTSPPIAARALAIAHTCIFDAWAAYDDTARATHLSESIRRPKPERTTANQEKAIDFAAYRALVDLFPSLQTTVLDPVMRKLSLEPKDASGNPTGPASVGSTACQAVLDFRHRDGSNQFGDLHPGPYSDYTGYTPVNRAVLIDPNRWQPMFPDGVPQLWLLPHWGQVVPFALNRGSEFRSFALSRGPYQYPSLEYWKQTLDLVDMSAHLTDTQKAIAEYWADGFATVTPAGHWNVIAQSVSRRDRHTLAEDAKLFFILNNALLDTSIAVWDVKRASDSVRPATVIRSMMGNRRIVAWAGPGLGVHEIDCKDFRSYLPTPPFGGYVSGHSAFSSAAAEILARFTGSDYFGESATIAAGSSLIERGLTPANPLTLSWATFTEAADQAGISRRYGGIHFESDDLVGRALGRLVANAAWIKAATYF